MRNYKISYGSIYTNEYYVIDLQINEVIFAGSHIDCVYLATRLNESDDSFHTVFNEMKYENRKYVQAF